MFKIKKPGRVGERSDDNLSPAIASKISRYLAGMNPAWMISKLQRVHHYASCFENNELNIFSSDVPKSPEAQRNPTETCMIRVAYDVYI